MDADLPNTELMQQWDDGLKCKINLNGWLYGYETYIPLDIFDIKSLEIYDFEDNESEIPENN